MPEPTVNEKIAIFEGFTYDHRTGEWFTPPNADGVRVIVRTDIPPDYEHDIDHAMRAAVRMATTTNRRMLISIWPTGRIRVVWADQCIIEYEADDNAAPAIAAAVAAAIEAKP